MSVNYSRGKNCEFNRKPFDCLMRTYENFISTGNREIEKNRNLATACFKFRNILHRYFFCGDVSRDTRNITI